MNAPAAAPASPSAAPVLYLEEVASAAPPALPTEHICPLPAPGTASRVYSARPTGGRDVAPKAVRTAMWLWEAGDTWILLAIRAGPFHAESLPSSAMIQHQTRHQSRACAQCGTWIQQLPPSTLQGAKAKTSLVLAHTSTAFGLCSYVHPTQTQGEGPQNTAVSRRKADADQLCAAVLRHKTSSCKLNPFLSIHHLHTT